MLCTIYKSSVKADTYLYIERRDDFSRVPDKLLETFGTPVFVMVLNISGQKKLALADKDKVMDHLSKDGFYLQMPPPQEDLLKEHLAAQKQASNSDTSNEGWWWYLKELFLLC